jgi:hypothetical protein
VLCARLFEPARRCLDLQGRCGIGARRRLAPGVGELGLEQVHHRGLLPLPDVGERCDQPDDEITGSYRAPRLDDPLDDEMGAGDLEAGAELVLLGGAEDPGDTQRRPGLPRHDLDHVVDIHGDSVARRSAAAGE